MEKQKIKVMQLISHMDEGGAQRIVLNYLEDLKNDSDIETKLYVYRKATNSHWDKIIKEKELNVEYLNAQASKVKIPYIKRWFNRRLAEKQWEKAIKEFKPDVVHVHISEFLLFTLKPIVNSRVPVRFTTLHDDPSRKKGKKLRIISHAFQKEQFIPVCITKEQALIGQKCFGFKDYEVVKNGIDVQNIKEKMVSKDKARELYNIPNDAYVIIGVGRLSDQKNFGLLIDAFNIVLKQRPNALLIIAGKGPELANLQKKTKKLKIEDKVRFIGSQDNIVPLYCAADIMGIPSIKEPCSLVLLESQVCGLRNVISSAVPDESIITDKVKKMLPNATNEDWANALQDQSYNGKAVCNMSENEVHFVSQRMKDLYIKYWKKYKNKEN